MLVRLAASLTVWRAGPSPRGIRRGACCAPGAGRPSAGVRMRPGAGAQHAVGWPSGVDRSAMWSENAPSSSIRAPSARVDQMRAAGRARRGSLNAAGRDVQGQQPSRGYPGTAQVTFRARLWMPCQIGPRRSQPFRQSALEVGFMKTTRSMRWASKVRGWRRSWLTVLAGAACLAVGLPLSLAAQVAAVTPASADLAPPASVPQLIPKPVAMTVGQGSFTLAATARIVVPSGSEAALPVAQDLAGYLRPATGYSLPVVTGGVQSGDIELILGDP